MGASHHQGTATANEEFLQQFGQRAVAQFSLQHRFGLRIPAGDRITNHHKVRVLREVNLGVSGHHSNAPFSQERGHRWIDHILIGAGDLVPKLVHGHCRAGHRRAADPDEMNATKIPEHGSTLRRGHTKPKSQTSTIRSGRPVNNHFAR